MLYEKGDLIMGIGSSRHSREGGDEHRPLLEGQSTTVGVGASGRVPLDFASMSDEDRRNRLSKKPLKKRLGEFTHLHSKETPEENRARFFERNTDAIGKLRKEIQSIRSKNSLGIRTFKGIKDKIKDIEGSFVRHEHKRYL